MEGEEELPDGGLAFTVELLFEAKKFTDLRHLISLMWPAISRDL